MEEAKCEKCLKNLGKWKGRHPRQGKQQEQRTKIGLRRVPNTYTNHRYCFLHLTDEETEARRSQVTHLGSWRLEVMSLGFKPTLAFARVPFLPPTGFALPDTLSSELGSLSENGDKNDISTKAI